MFNIHEYIGKNFKHPKGIGGKIATFFILLSTDGIFFPIMTLIATMSAIILVVCEC